MDERIERRVLDKADYVKEAVTVLAERRDSLSFEKYTADRLERDVVEREFETAIQACIDIGRLLPKVEEEEVPGTNAAVFQELGELGILDATVAHRMGEAAGFRNVLSHRYGIEIDDRDVYNVLQSDLSLFKSYLEAVRRHLQ